MAAGDLKEIKPPRSSERLLGRRATSRYAFGCRPSNSKSLASKNVQAVIRIGPARAPKNYVTPTKSFDELLTNRLRFGAFSFASVRGLKSRRFVCMSFALRKLEEISIGYPAWIRTKNNASKGRCVTVTPRGISICDFRSAIFD